MENNKVEPATEARDMFVQIALGYMGSQVVNVAARLGIADELASGPRTAEQVAASLGTHSQSTHRLMRAMATMSMTVETEPGLFKLTPFGALLRSDVEGSVLQTVKLFCSPNSWDSWGALEHSVRTGESSWAHVSGGKSAFDFFDDDPEMSKVFNDAMAEGTEQVAPALPELYDFARFNSIVDIGGGNGTLLRHVLAANADLRGVVFDLQAGLEDTAAVLADAGLTDRCTAEVGDFFEAVPAGHDAYIMKSVIHDWNDDECVEILSNCRKVVPDDGRVFILEPVIPECIDSMEFIGTIMSDLNMLCVATGRERTETEFRSLFERSGFRLEGVHGPVGAFHMQLLEGIPG